MSDISWGELIQDKTAFLLPCNVLEVLQYQQWQLPEGGTNHLALMNIQLHFSQINYSIQLCMMSAPVTSIEIMNDGRNNYNL